MTARWSVDGEQNVAASPGESCLGITGGAGVVPAVHMLSLGCEDTPADNSLIWYGQRNTAAGTATAVTPQQVSGRSRTTATTAGENHTVEPTYTANAILFRLGLNQRASHSLFFGDDGALECLAVSSNGLGLFPVHASATPLVSALMHYLEK